MPSLVVVLIAASRCQGHRGAGSTCAKPACLGRMQAGRAMKLARGLSFIFLFSEFNQINANSKFCTSLI
jgi:hypothetical protein